MATHNNRIHSVLRVHGQDWEPFNPFITITLALAISAADWPADWPAGWCGLSAVHCLELGNERPKDTCEKAASVEKWVHILRLIPQHISRQRLARSDARENTDGLSKGNRGSFVLEGTLRENMKEVLERKGV